MRGHGAVVAGRTLEEVVMTAIYLQVNAKVLSTALLHGSPKGLSAGEIERCRETQNSDLAVDRAWERAGALLCENLSRRSIRGMKTDVGFASVPQPTYPRDLRRPRTPAPPHRHAAARNAARRSRRRG